MNLFDEIQRDNTEPKGYAEPDFTYYNRSARPDIAAVRDLLERWFCHYPVRKRWELRRRFRDTHDWVHRPAFFELFVHELLLLLGCKVKVEPPPRTRRGKRPDFLAEPRTGSKFYVEATTATGESLEEQATKAREDVLYDALNRMQSPDFFIGMRIEGSSKKPIPTRNIKSFLTGHLRGLDPEEIRESWKIGTGSRVSRWHYQYEGMRFTFFPIPKGPKYRGKPGVRPIAYQSLEARKVTTADAIRSAVLKKASRYGKVRLPYVIAVNVLSEVVHDTGIEEALFGSERMTIPYGCLSAGDPVWTRAPDGALTGSSGKKHTRVSGILIVSKLRPGNVPRAKIQLYHNPSARIECPRVLACFPQAFAPDGANVNYRNGKSLTDLFSLPIEWPEV